MYVCMYFTGVYSHVAVCILRMIFVILVFLVILQSFIIFISNRNSNLQFLQLRKICERPRRKLCNFVVVQGSAKISYFNVLHENNNLYATNMYFLEAPIFNGEDDVSLTRKRRSILGKHSLRIVVNAVRYVVRINSRASAASVIKGKSCLSI